VAGRVLGPEVAVRDYGLLEAALARPGPRRSARTPTRRSM
jgi:hypothetical protein